jgi:alanyl-tRNA synthetase
MKRRLRSDEIRETFLRFFTERQHARIDAASIIPANDPTLLFINAGMAPLKPYFLGAALPPAPDLCNVQPCVRTVDIGDVGDRHHLTFFEMLGSWSIGHYFKERAVELAFELLTQGFGFGVPDLYVTVFGGDDALGIAPDDVSAAAWERVGVPRDYIVYLGAEDNFWSAGDTGPCGPCTEVFYDTGAAHGEQYRPGGISTAPAGTSRSGTPGCSWSSTGGLSALVTDTQSTGGQHLHYVQVTDGVLRFGDTAEVAVDAERRRSIMRNHSATHLLHAALRRVLGDHVCQAGSLVAPDRLRFDFLHPRALSEGETEQVERLVNAEVLANAERTTVIKPYQDAIRDGRSRSSARSPAMTSGWCRSAASPPSCAAARTCTAPPRSACS